MQNQLSTNMYTTILLAITSVSLIGLTASSLEAKPGRGGSEKDSAAIFEAIDANGNGKITPNELAESKRFKDASPKEVGAAFAEKDLDGDGAIGPKEFAKSSGDGKRGGKGGKSGKGGSGSKGGKGGKGGKGA